MILARFPDVTWAALAAEVAREVALRRTTYGGWIEKGRMTRAEADWQIAVMTAIGRDVAAMAEARHEPDEAARWQDKLAVLRREIEFRLRLYPGWISKGRITVTDARTRCAALECLIALYEEGWGWMPANGVPPAWGSTTPTAEQAASRTEWRDIWATTEARRIAGNDNQQQRMAL